MQYLYMYKRYLICRIYTIVNDTTAKLDDIWQNFFLAVDRIQMYLYDDNF
jgi:hypothetical protein